MFQYWWDGYRKIFNYKGRASRRSFIVFFFGQIIFSAFLSIILDPTLPNMSGVVRGGIILTIVTVYSLTLLSYSVRRAHDIDMSGAFCFLYLLLGWVLIIVLMFIPPSGGENKYGPDPRNKPVGKDKQIAKDVLIAKKNQL